MEENKTKNTSLKGLYIVIVVLLIAVIGMGLYICYDKNVIFSKKVNKDKTENNVIKNNTTTDNKLSEEEAMNIGKELFNYTIDTYYGKVWNFHYSDEINASGGHDIICDSSMEEVLNKYSKDFKAEYATNTVISKEEFVGMEACNGGFGAHVGGSNQLYKGPTEITNVKTIEENEIVFNVTSEYHDDIPPTKVVKKEHDFIIKKENGIWVISYFYIPYYG